MSTALSESAAKIPNTKLLDTSLYKNDSDSSIAKVELFTPIDSLKKYPGSIVLSLKDAIIQALSNNDGSRNFGPSGHRTQYVRTEKPHANGATSRR